MSNSRFPTFAHLLLTSIIMMMMDMQYTAVNTNVETSPLSIYFYGLYNVSCIKID
jgi:hypothetical protein